MAVLLLADVIEGKLATDQVAKTLTAVKSLGPVTVLVAGMGGDAAAAEAATLDGVASDAEALRIPLDGGLHRVAIGLGAAR